MKEMFTCVCVCLNCTKNNIGVPVTGAWWLSGTFSAFRLEGRRFEIESHSSRHIGTYGLASPSLTVACSALAC